MKGSKKADTAHAVLRFTVFLGFIVALATAFALPAAAQPTNEDFDSVSAEVTDTAWFSGDAQEVTFTYLGGNGEATFTAGDRSRTVTTDGSGSVSVRFGGFFSGIDYPVEVSVTTSNRTCTATINGPDDEVTVCDGSRGDYGGDGGDGGDGFLDGLLSPRLTITEGYMQVGEGDNSTRFEFNKCPDGEPAVPDEKCNTIDARVHLSNLSITAAPEDINFHNLTFFSETLQQNVTIVPEPRSRLQGGIDFSSLSLNVQGDLRATVPALSNPENDLRCGSTISLALTTGESGDLSGGIVNPFSREETGLVRLVDGRFSVPEASSCGALDGAVNDELGLPSPSGENEMSVNMRLGFGGDDGGDNDGGDGGEFDVVTAEVTDETWWFHNPKEVTFEYRAPRGARVTLEADGESVTDTSTGSPGTVRVRLGGFFFGGRYPVDVTASIAGGQTCEATIDRNDGEIVVCETQQEEPADFQVSDLDPRTATVTQGEVVDVGATVSNQGDVEATQTVEFRIDGNVVSSRSVTLAGGASESVSFQVDTSGLSAGDHTHGVFTLNDSATGTLTVEVPQANFDVSITGTNSPVREGSTLSVTADVTNTGDASDTQTVTLDVAGAQRDSTSVSLSGGQTQSVSLDWTTSTGDVGSYTAEVASDDSTDTISVAVEEPSQPAFFDVTITGTNSPVVEGETLAVNADVTNTGGRQDTQAITLSSDALANIDSTSLTLDAGETAGVSLNAPTGISPEVLPGPTYPITGNLTVSSSNDSDTVTVTVNAPPSPADFQVTDVQTNSPVLEGETLTVDASVQNTGDNSGTQTVALAVDGSQEDSRSLTLSAGESDTVTLSWVTTSGDAGSHTATVSSSNDSASTSVMVNEPSPADLEVSVTGTNSPVVEGDTLTIDASVENTGGVSGSQTVTLSIDGNQEDSQSVTLAAGASTTISLSWTTAVGDAGTHTATVSGTDTSDSATVTVNPEPEPFYSVSIDSTNSPVTEGETLSVQASVENTGDASGTKDVALTIDGSAADTASVSLAAGASQTITLDWMTSSSDAGSHTASVTTPDASDSTTVTVEEPVQPPNFQVSVTGSNSPVTAGGTLTVNADVTNTGGSSGTQTVTLDVSGVQRDTTSVTLASGDSTSVSLSWTTSTGDAGSHTATVASVNDTASTPVEVQEAPDPPFFSVSVTGTNSPVTEGDALSVSASVTNTGDLQDTQTIALTVNGAEQDSTSVTLAGGASQSVTLDWTTTSGDAGSHTATVASADSSDSTAVTVQQPAFFDVTLTGTNSPVLEGETLTVDASVQNTGDVQGTQDIILEIDGSTMDTASGVSLAAGASTSVSLSWTTSSGDAGTHTASIASADTSDSASVSVDAPPANFQVSITGTNSPVNESDTLTVTADVTNTGGESDTQTVALDVAGAERDSQSVSLAAGATQSVSLSWTTSSGDNGTYTATVSSTDSSDSTSVTVNTPQVSYQSFTAYVEDGYLDIGGTRAELPHCPNGVPEDTSLGCIQFTAAYDEEAGTYTAQPEDLQFPDVEIDTGVILIGTVPVSTTATSPITGSFDSATGDTTMNAEMRALIQGGVGCTLELSVAGTTGSSGSLTGEANPLRENGTAEPTVVDNEFSVPAVPSGSCGFAGTVNNQLGLPSGSGENELVMEMYIEFHEEPASEITGG